MKTPWKSMKNPQKPTKPTKFPRKPDKSPKKIHKIPEKTLQNPKKIPEKTLQNPKKTPQNSWENPTKALRKTCKIFISGATLAHLLTANITADPFWSTYLYVFYFSKCHLVYHYRPLSLQVLVCYMYLDSGYQHLYTKLFSLNTIEFFTISKSYRSDRNKMQFLKIVTN